MAAENRFDLNPGMRVLLATALVVVVIAGLKASAPMVNFLLISLFLAVIAASPVGWLERRGLPSFFAILTVIVVLIVAAATLPGGSEPLVAQAGTAESDPVSGGGQSAASSASENTVPRSMIGTGRS